MLHVDTIYNEDCFSGLARLPSASIDLVVTDPPYVVSTKSGGGVVNNKLKLNQSLRDLDKADIVSGYDMKAMASELDRLQGGCLNAYFWCNKAQMPAYFDIYVSQYGCKFDVLTWHKRNALPTYCNKYLTDTEYLLYFHKGATARPSNYADAQTYAVSLINHKDKRQWKHPTIKPLDWMRKVVRNSSEQGQVVLDPFMGSGTTAVACILEQRHYIGFELNAEYWRIAQERIKAETQQLKLF